jgi:pimeloyl-ACP methyl ester carboxylesterase
MIEQEFNGTAYREYGKNTDPAVFMIHGLGLNKDVWQWQIPVLQNDYHVISYDLYGHAQSVAPTENPSLSLFSKQLSGLMDFLEIDRATLVGFSLGGMITRKFAQDAPERTDRLVILHSPHLRTSAAQSAIMDRVEQARLYGSAATVEAALERWFTAGFKASNPVLMDLVRSWVLANKTDVYHTIYRVLVEGIDEIIAPNPAISCPTLVVTGDQDFGNGPEMSNAIGGEILGSDVRIVSGLRHMGLAENPTVVNHLIIDFLKATLLK